jgi:hypothetical protein
MIETDFGSSPVLVRTRVLFDRLVTGEVLPATRRNAVCVPKYVVKTGKTPVLVLDPCV